MVQPSAHRPAARQPGPDQSSEVTVQHDRLGDADDRSADRALDGERTDGRVVTNGGRAQAQSECESDASGDDPAKRRRADMAHAEPLRETEDRAGDRSTDDRGYERIDSTDDQPGGQTAEGVAEERRHPEQSCLRPARRLGEGGGCLHVECAFHQIVTSSSVCGTARVRAFDVEVGTSRSSHSASNVPSPSNPGSRGRGRGG